MKPTLTIFTPTYNRGYCINQGYEALCRQTLKDFVWIVVDDGSTDNTRELVAEWQKQNNGFEIKYVYKKNEGLASGYNVAISIADTELCMCVDSDDYLEDDSVRRIIEFWKNKGSNEYAGIVGLNFTPQGKMIGDPLPNQKTINLIDLGTGKYKIKNGDRRYVVRTDVYKSVAPMKIFEGEKDINPQYMHIKMSLEYDFLVMNENLCFVDYQSDGMTTTVFKQYLRSPKSFREMRLLDISLKGVPFSFTVKKMIHYISSCILAKEPCVSASPRRFMTILLYPCGWLLTMYLKNTKKEHK